jgi:alkanesulfonate monooxygenase SsuD/methylene tetrahydromethanopterin reductase-like flavin-dependent oxidoreductase (luciferase family)
VALMPHEFIHPARVAEKVATVDVLSRGRVEWGMGRSTPMEQTAFHVDIRAFEGKDAGGACKTVCGMWEQEYYSRNTPNSSNFPPRMVTPKPYQYPAPAGVDGGVEPEETHPHGRAERAGPAVRSRS